MGENTISIEFQSAISYVEGISQQEHYPILPQCVPPAYHGTCGANLIRKEQCSFSWDWGPSFPTQGIWKDIYIQAYSQAVIRDVTSQTIKQKDGSWQLNVEVFMEVLAGLTAPGNIEIKLDKTSVTQSIPVILSSTNKTAKLTVDIPKSVFIQQWWPNGYGNQTLYDLYVFYTDAFGSMNTRKIRMGFRTVEIVQDYVSADKTAGRSFYFKINGQPIYFKGSNWIPADSFQERITRDRIYNYLKSAADVHMNSMRVWGGGVYESDMFYEIADELGIMIWQDFMFACAMYPTDPEFLATVTQEVTHQLRRLKHHPSIVVLSGNNENEKALVQSWYGTDVNFTRYKDDYIKLYIDVIRTIVEREDTSRPFLSSSPSNGLQTEVEGWVAKDPWSTKYGDIHEYKYLVPFFDPSQYRIPRFSSEYGLQSYPSMETLEPVYTDADMDYWGNLNEYRNHHPFGNIQMMAEVIQYLNLPNSPNIKQKFKDSIYVTQITHAIGMRTETEHYRRWQNRLDNEGQGNTMGALYWMLADIWQAPTWASLEYGGKWKMLHYYANHFFAPTLISPYMDGNNLDVYIVMDELEMTEHRHKDTYNLHFKPKSNPRPFYVFDASTWGNQATRSGNLDTNMVLDSDVLVYDNFTGNLYIEMYSWDSLTALHTWKIPFKMNLTAESVFSRNIDAMVTEARGIRRQNCVLYFHFGNTEIGPTSWLNLSPFNSAQGLQKPNILITNVISTSTANAFNVTITTDAIAPFTWLEAYGVKGRFSDNGFMFLKPTKTVQFYAWEAVNIDKLKSSLSVMSLMDIYH